MQRLHKAAIAMATAGVLISGVAQAALIDRGGGLIYDDVLNVIWLQDANLAVSKKTLSSIYLDGSMERDTADIWLNSLNHDNYQGFNNWRLPRVTFELVYGKGYVINTSEFQHLFGEVGGKDFEPFQNIQSGFYWSDWLAGTGSAWTFSFMNGSHNLNYGSAGYVLLVRDGDVPAIPEPVTIGMLLAGLGLLGVVVKRRRLS